MSRGERLATWAVTAAAVMVIAATAAGGRPEPWELITAGATVIALALIALGRDWLQRQEPPGPAPVPPPPGPAAEVPGLRAVTAVMSVLVLESLAGLGLVLAGARITRAYLVANQVALLALAAWVLALAWLLRRHHRR